VLFKKLPEDYIEENIDYVSYLAFFSKKNENQSKLVSIAELADIEVGIYRD